MTRPKKSLFVVCGEPSGETYAVAVVRAFRARFPGVPVRAVGGDRLRAAGAEIVADYAGISVVGLTEVLRHLPEIRRTLRLAIREATAHDVGAVLLVDFPDFNFRVGEKAAARNVPVVYYVPPQLWAWRKGRASQLARFTRGVVVAFPFETAPLAEKGVNVRFAGHPLLDELAPHFDRTTDLPAYGIPEGSTVVGLLPGSRESEIRRLLQPMVQAARRIAGSRPDACFAIPVAAPRFRDVIGAAFRGSGVRHVLVDRDRHGLFGAMGVAISASGTATLELALFGVPTVIVYRTSPLTYRIGRRLVSVDCIGLPNIVSGEKFLPELIQDECTPERMAIEALGILEDPARRVALSERCRSLRGVLHGTGPTGAVVEMLEGVSEGAWA